jgi:hypothetical protein
MRYSCMCVTVLLLCRQQPHPACHPSADHPHQDSPQHKGPSCDLQVSSLLCTCPCDSVTAVNQHGVSGNNACLCSAHLQQLHVRASFGHVQCCMTCAGSNRWALACAVQANRVQPPKK